MIYTSLKMSKICWESWLRRKEWFWWSRPLITETWMIFVNTIGRIKNSLKDFWKSSGILMGWVNQKSDWLLMKNPKKSYYHLLEQLKKEFSFFRKSSTNRWNGILPKHSFFQRILLSKILLTKLNHFLITAKNALKLSQQYTEFLGIGIIWI